MDHRINSTCVNLTKVVLEEGRLHALDKEVWAGSNLHHWALSFLSLALFPLEVSSLERAVLLGLGVREQSQNGNRDDNNLHLSGFSYN